MRGAATLPSTVDRNVGRYIPQIQRVPMLEVQEEQALAKRWRERGDHAAADRLVTSHLRLVAKIAWGCCGCGLPMSDLISEGSLRMLEAVKRYDPARGFRLASYATLWIRAQIQDYVLRSWSLVRLGTTANQRKLFFNLRRLKAQLTAIGDGEFSPDAVAHIAADLAVPATDVVIVNRRLCPVASLNTPLPDDTAEWQDQLADERSDQETQLGEQEQSRRRRAMLGIALARLEPRERDIVNRTPPPRRADPARRLGDALPRHDRTHPADRMRRGGAASTARPRDRARTFGASPRAPGVRDRRAGRSQRGGGFTSYPAGKTFRTSYRCIYTDRQRRLT